MKNLPARTAVFPDNLSGVLVDAEKTGGSGGRDLLVGFIHAVGGDEENVILVNHW